MRGSAAAREKVRGLGAAAGRWVRRVDYLRRWIVLGIAIGAIAGLGAVAFYWLLTEATRLLLGGIGGYHPPKPAGEGGRYGDGDHLSRWWLIPLITAAGGLLSGALVFRFAPEAEGHGTDAAIDAVHSNPRKIRARAVLVKLIASAVTIGSGGSGGREGPTAQISAGFGSLLARWLDLSPEDARIAVSVGIGSGIGAIFGAPLGGAVTAADIVYRDDFEVEALIPGLIASITSYSIFGFLEGWRPLFGYAAPGYQFHRPVELMWFALIGAVAGLVGLLYSSTFYAVTAVADRLPVSRVIKPAIGGLLVGAIALALPQAMGTGYGWIQQALTRGTLQHIAVWVVVLLPVAKIVTTSLSIGSGGSGGIFGPGMVIGAFVGAAVWRVFDPLGWGVPQDPAPFVVVGMMACFGAIARAPLAMMLMVAEMTGSLTLLAPAMAAVGVAYLIVRRADATIYRSQLHNREEARAARLLTGMPLLDRITVAAAMATPRLLLRDDTTASAAVDQLAAVGVPGAPVVDEEGRFIGVATLSTLRTRADEHHDATILNVTDTTVGRVLDTASLDDAVDALPSGHQWLTVINDERRVAGILAISDIVHAYHRALRADLARLSGLTANAGVTETQIAAASPVVGKTLRTAALPDGTIVLSIRRDNTVIAATGTTQLQAADIITAICRPEHEQELRDRLAPEL